MAQASEEKERLIAQMARARQELSGCSLALQHHLNFGRHASESLHRFSGWWVGLAAVFGWVLSRLPARKKHIYIDPTDRKAVRRARRGNKAGLGSAVWGGLWSLAKPLLTAYLTKKIAERQRVA